MITTSWDRTKDYCCCSSITRKNTLFVDIREIPQQIMKSTDNLLPYDMKIHLQL